MRWKSGGCHCGAVVFEVLAPDEIEVEECNCSICAMTGYLHLIVEKDRFRLLKGEAALATYEFNTGIAKHKFCKTCGIKSFYIPRSHPNGYSVNARCLDSDRVRVVGRRMFDGRNWERHMESRIAEGSI